MAYTTLSTHPNRLSQRLINRICDALHQDCLIIVPTENGLSYACLPEARGAIAKINQIKPQSKQKAKTLLIHQIKGFSHLAQVGDSEFKFLKRFAHFPITTILKASKLVPKFVSDVGVKKRKLVGLRLTSNPLLCQLIESCGPLLVSSFNQDQMTTTFENIEDTAFFEQSPNLEQIKRLVDFVIDIGHCPTRASAVVDMSQNEFRCLRLGVVNAKDHPELFDYLQQLSSS